MLDVIFATRGLGAAPREPVPSPGCTSRRQGVIDSLGNAAGSPCHARDALGRFLGLPKTEPCPEFTLAGQHSPQVEVRGA
jgi:hypothetical protein